MERGRWRRHCVLKNSPLFLELLALIQPQLKRHPDIYTPKKIKRHGRISVCYQHLTYNQQKHLLKQLAIKQMRVDTKRKIKVLYSFCSDGPRTIDYKINVNDKILTEYLYNCYGSHYGMVPFTVEPRNLVDTPILLPLNFLEKEIETWNDPPTIYEVTYDNLVIYFPNEIVKLIIKYLQDFSKIQCTQTAMALRQDAL